MVGGERVENTMPKWSSSISGEGTSTTGGPAGCEGGGEGKGVREEGRGRECEGGGEGVRKDGRV